MAYMGSLDSRALSLAFRYFILWHGWRCVIRLVIFSLDSLTESQT